MKDCYITAAGAFLPGEPISNDEVEDYLGKIDGQASRAKARVLRQNQIRTRHYAMDKNQNTTISNSGMAANSIRQAIEKSNLDLKDIELLVTASTQGDLLLPGFASMVHGELGTPPCEIASLHGVCASSVAAFRHAVMAVQTEEAQNAVCCASEFSSRFFKASRFEDQGYGRDRRLPFESEFLRWMLSDGAGALVMQNRPNEKGLSLKIDRVELRSYAGQHPPCMYVGDTDEVRGEQVRGWLDYPNVRTAADEGVMNLKQTINLLGEVVQLTVDGVFDLIEKGKLNPSEINWYVAHYSSHIFKEQAYELLCRGGLRIDPERIFTNLYDKGNMGAASPFVMLEELFGSGKLEPGQKLLCIVPESGRFTFGYMQMTVVGEPAAAAKVFEVDSPEEIEAPDIKTTGTEIEESLVRKLSRVWVEFESSLNHVPIVAKMNLGRLTIEDYRSLLFNMRQQVIDGSRWISRAASNITRENFPIRSAFIGHSSDEHRDFEMLARNYVAAGGSLEKIQNGRKNIGSEALSEYILSRASRENPFDLIGAMFIIEGLGRRVARRWALRIQEQLDLADDQVSFLLYHSESDDLHFERLDLVVQSGILTEQRVEDIVKVAKVVARLYRLQLEEIGNY